MRELSSGNFGLVVAYLIPGAVSLIGVEQLLPAAYDWLSSPHSPTIGGFLYLTLASVGAGLTVSTLRWMILDKIHYATGIKSKEWDFRHLQKNLDSFLLLVESHYRYYQFYANTVVAILFSYGAWRLTSPLEAGPTDILALGLAAIFFVGSRDTLKKYYQRADALLRSVESVEAAESDG